MRLGAVTVLYNPEKSVFDNIQTYVHKVDKLYIVDNSDFINRSLKEKMKSFSNVIYINNANNLGIAKALNIGAEYAIQDGCRLLLTMDQDSRFSSNEIGGFIDRAKKMGSNVGILSPQIYKDELLNNPFNELVSITSGSILDLEIYLKVGGFNNNLFIDSVDTEYCLRMNLMGFLLKRDKNTMLVHRLGDQTVCNLPFRECFTTNHPPLRRYYIARNRFYVWHKYKYDYPEYIKYEKRVTTNEIIKIILCEKNKLQKLKMFIKGYLDYRKNILGKYIAG